MPIEEIVDKQLSSPDYCIVGLATRNQGYHYKKEMYQRVLPAVFVHGSSRVMQFKGDYFTQTMFNSGGSMGSVHEGFSFLKEAFVLHKPKIMIMGIDYWWFSKNYMLPPAEIRPPLPLSHRISLRSYLLPYEWLWQKKLTFSDYFHTMNPMYYFKRSLTHGIGVDGALNRTGFGPDGSYIYTKTVIGKEKSNVEAFQLKGHVFDKEAVVDEAHFNHFLAMVDFIRQNKVKVIFFIPPVAPTIENKMKHLKVVDELRNRLRLAEIPYYDFHDPRILKTSDCEFVDATHGGDLLYARILGYLASHEPALKSYLDLARIDYVTHHLQHLARIPCSRVTKEPEIDFLEIGCDKSTQYHFDEPPERQAFYN